METLSGLSSHRPGKFGGNAAARWRRLPAADLPALLICCSLGPAALAQNVGNAGQELQRQQERERLLREEQESVPDVRLSAPLPDDAAALLPSSETPCFVIERIVLRDDAAAFDWALDAVDRAGARQRDPARGRCLGSAGIGRVLQRVQNAIVARGYVTTRVVAAPQDLRDGTLTLTVVAGRVGAIRFSADSDARANALGAVTLHSGDLLDLRDIEQTLENFKRVPTADVNIEIVPGAQPGESDLVIRWKQAFPLRLTLTADDGGLSATGKYLGSATLSFDNPLRLNDLFYASVNHDLGGGQEGERGTHGYTLHYSLPWGNWLLGATASGNSYFQSVAGAVQNYRYSGRSSNDEIKVSRLLRRDATSRSRVSLRAYLTTSDNAIDDTEIAVQRRRMAGWEAAIEHRAYIGDATLDVNLAYRHGTGAFGAIAAPEEAVGEGSARPIIVSTDNRIELPFTLAGLALRYSGVWRAQWNRTPLVAQDRFAIGGRYSVRGFDGENVLMADRGWLLRNDLALEIAGGGHEVYAAVDCGRVGGQPAEQLVGRSLCGTVAGLRGSQRLLAYDFFVGQPLRRPAGFETARVTAGFNLILSF